MRFERSFTVPASPSAVLAALTDVERVAGVLPGGLVDGRARGERFGGQFALQLGSATAPYSAIVAVAEHDRDAGRAIVSVRANDDQGDGTADVTATFDVAAADPGSSVAAVVEVELGGRLADVPDADGVATAYARNAIAQLRAGIVADAGAAPAPVGETTTMVEPGGTGAADKAPAMPEPDAPSPPPRAVEPLGEPTAPSAAPPAGSAGDAPERHGAPPASAPPSPVEPLGASAASSPPADVAGDARERHGEPAASAPPSPVERLGGPEPPAAERPEEDRDLPSPAPQAIPDAGPPAAAEPSPEITGDTAAEPASDVADHALHGPPPPEEPPAWAERRPRPAAPREDDDQAPAGGAPPTRPAAAEGAPRPAPAPAPAPRTESVGPPGYVDRADRADARGDGRRKRAGGGLLERLRGLFRR